MLICSCSLLIFSCPCLFVECTSLRQVFIAGVLLCELSISSWSMMILVCGPVPVPGIKPSVFSVYTECICSHMEGQMFCFWQCIFKGQGPYVGASGLFFFFFFFFFFTSVYAGDCSGAGIGELFWISLGEMVTGLEWMGHGLVSVAMCSSGLVIVSSRWS